jgi:hypothetical protein
MWELVESAGGEMNIVITGFYPSEVACPIDGTRLTEVVGMDFNAYFCQYCDSFYAWGNDEPGDLQAQARRNMEKILERREKAENDREKLKLESLICSAEEKGFL